MVDTFHIALPEFPTFEYKQSVLIVSLFTSVMSLVSGNGSLPEYMEQFLHIYAWLSWRCRYTSLPSLLSEKTSMPEAVNGMQSKSLSMSILHLFKYE